MKSRLLRATRYILRRLVVHYHNLTFWAPTRPTVLIQSDDWGRVGAPNLSDIEELKEDGYKVGDSKWDFYGLESEDDLESLSELLISVKDKDGSNAIMSAVFIMANADLEKIRQDDYKRFYGVSIDCGVPSPWTQNNLARKYKELVNKGVFFPALHGYTHFNPELLVSISAEDSERGLRTRAMHERDIPYLASLTPEFNFALCDRSNKDERCISNNDQLQWINKGVDIFKRMFGEMPFSTCPPGYRFSDYTCKLWRDIGIKVVHTAGGTIGYYNKLWVTPRNVMFEPFLYDNAFEAALLEATVAIKKGYPIIISTHSINYIDRHLKYAEQGRKQLLRLLNELKRRYPNLRFSNEKELFETWSSRNPSWWRRPNIKEIKRRFLGACRS